MVCTHSATDCACAARNRAFASSSPDLLFQWLLITQTCWLFAQGASSGPLINNCATSGGRSKTGYSPAGHSPEGTMPKSCGVQFTTESIISTVTRAVSTNMLLVSGNYVSKLAA